MAPSATGAPPGRRVYRVCDAVVIPYRAGDAAGSTAQRGADKIGRVTPTRVFLLSPANCRGRRAQQVLSPKAAFSVAARLRSDGVPIGELFAHMSGLYFRGKITYARKFGRAFVITPDQGLLPAETTITSQVLSRFADAEIDLGNPAISHALEQTARELGDAAGADAQFVLLGSIASDKYVQVLSAIFGQRLVFPATFVGRGDMSRGGVLLRAAAASQELEYIPVIGAVRHGSPAPETPSRGPVFPHNSHTLMCDSISGGGVCSTSVGLGGFATQNRHDCSSDSVLRLVSVRCHGRGARAGGAAEFLRPHPLDVARPTGRRLARMASPLLALSNCQNGLARSEFRDHGAADSCGPASRAGQHRSGSRLRHPELPRLRASRIPSQFVDIQRRGATTLDPDSAPTLTPRLLSLDS